MASKSPPKRAFITRLTRHPYMVGALPTIGGFLFGCDIVSSMSAQLDNPYYLSQFNNPNSDLQGGITAAMPAGSFGGALINSYLADKIGRKRCLILSGWIWVVGCIIQAVSNNVRTLVAGRVVAGIAVGIASAIVTVYQAEITKPNIRGRIVSIQQLAIMTGIMDFLQYGCSYINSNTSFRLPWGLQAIPGALLGSLMFLFPESPRYLMDRGRETDALQVLADVHAEGDTEDLFVQLEFAEIQRQIEFDKTQAAKSYFDLLKPDVRRRVLLGCADQMWSQLSGMNVMMYYVTYVFQSAGLTGRRAGLIASSVQYVLAVLVTIPAVIWIDRWGRRPMLLYGAIFMALWLLLVGSLQAGFGHAVVDASSSDTTTWAIDENNKAVSYVIIVFMYFFVCSFSSTWGPCSWTYASEIFPTRVRGKAVSSTPPAFRNIQYRTYFVYMTFNCVAAIMVFFMFPETKGYSLEQMEEVFHGNAFSAWNAGKGIVPEGGRKTVTAADIEAARGGDLTGHARHPGSEKGDLKPQISHDEKVETASH
ncbi:hypothetical protein JCM8097_000203 [Rhodosporidiobolus ruineniae]